MTRTIRLVDVAQAAGVSRGTASNVFNHPEIVRPEVRERVLATARQLGYGGPDPKGRLLRAGKVNAIGVVVAGTFAAGFRDPFGQLFMSGIGGVCDAHGAGLTLISAHDETNEIAAWNIQSALVDGFIVHCLEDKTPLLALARQRGLPFVAVDVDAEPGDIAIRIDDRNAARREAEHLLALGHRDIGVLALEFIGEGRFGFVDRERMKALRYAVTRDRLAGYADALGAAGIEIESLPMVETVLSRERGAAATAAILERAPRDYRHPGDVRRDRPRRPRLRRQRRPRCAERPVGDRLRRHPRGRRVDAAAHHHGAADRRKGTPRRRAGFCRRAAGDRHPRRGARRARLHRPAARGLKRRLSRAAGRFR